MIQDEPQIPEYELSDDLLHWTTPGPAFLRVLLLGLLLEVVDQQFGLSEPL